MDKKYENNFFKDIQCQIYTLKDAREDNILIVFLGETPVIFNINRASEYIYKIVYQKYKKYYTDIMHDVEDSSKLNLYSDIKQIKHDIIQESLAINNINYQPLSVQLFQDGGKIYYNSYRKSDLLCEASTQTFLKKKKTYIKDFKDIHELIYNLCSRNKGYTSWFIEWMAHLMQKPLHKLPTAVIFQGRQGTGKTKFQELVVTPLFSDNFKLTSQRQINTSRNTYVYGSQLVWVDEVSNNSGKFNMADTLKQTVTDKRVPVQELYKTEIVTINYAGYIVSTNHMIAIPLEEDDRRWSVFKSEKLGYNKGWKLIESLEKTQNKQLASFAIYLLNLDYDIKKISKPCETPARDRLIVNSMNNLNYFLTSIETDLKDIIDESAFLRDTRKEFYHTDEKNNRIYFFTNEFYDFYLSWCRINEIRNIYDRKKFKGILCDGRYRYGSYTIENKETKTNKRCYVTSLQPFKEGLFSDIEHE